MSACDELLGEIVTRFMRSVEETGTDYDAATLIASCSGGLLHQYGYIYHPDGNVTPWSGSPDTAVFLCDYRSVTAPLRDGPWDACVIRLDHATGRMDVEHLDGRGVGQWHLNENVLDVFTGKGTVLQPAA